MEVAKVALVEEVVRVRRGGGAGRGGSMGLGSSTGRGGGMGRGGGAGPGGSMGLGSSTGRGGSIGRGRGSFSKGRVSIGRGNNNGCGRNDETSEFPISPPHYNSCHVSHGSSHHVGPRVSHSGNLSTSHQRSPNHTSPGVSRQASLKNVSPGVSHHANPIVSDRASPSVSQYVSPNVSHNEGLDNMDTDDYIEEESSQHLEEDSNVVEQPPTNPSNRIEIWLLGEEFGDPKVGRKAVAILRSMYNGPWATWADVDSDSVGKLWGRFQKYFYWHPDIHEQVHHA